MFELTVVGSNAPALVDDAWAHLSVYHWRFDRHGAMATKDNAAATRALVKAIEDHARAVVDHKEEVQELRHEMSRRR